MNTIKTSKVLRTGELTGAALNWAAAKCWYGDEYDMSILLFDDGLIFAPSTNWSHGGPIIEREWITTSKEDGCWSAYFRDNLFEDDGSDHWQTGPTPLIAAMRCYVASKLGDAVEIPEELA